MSDTPVEIGMAPVISQEEVLPNLPNKHVMGPVHALAKLVMHAQTNYENGAVEDLHEHRDNGGTLLLLMTHFRRWEPIVIAQIVANSEPLQHLKYNTGVTARRWLFELPVVGYIVRNSGAQIVDRPTENKNETPVQRKARKEANQKAQAVGGRFLANGLNWLIFPEGQSRQVVEKDGQKVKVSREPGILFPIQKGFVYTLESMSEEERRKAKLLGVAVHYGDRLFPSLRPTVHISRPTAPVNGTVEEIRQQGEDLLRTGVSEAIRLAARRSA
jgi:1-acyl-sn-glycerol-3-phosphate acyltransferase